MSPLNGYTEFLEVIDLSGSADLAGLLEDLGSAFLNVWPVSTSGAPTYEVHYDHRLIRNTVAHGMAYRRGFVTCVKFSSTQA